MKKLIFAIAVLSIAFCVYGASEKISVMDFTVASDNPQFKFVGKGIAEMIAVELRKSPGITLIDREKRSALLEEMEFSLSDLADPDTEIKIGKMLSADYLLAGEIVDMIDAVLISLKLLKVESGEIVWNEMLTEKITRYDFIAAYFTKSILGYFNIRIAQSTTDKIESKTEKDKEAIIAFSNAIELYDNKDNAGAKKELEKAKAIDPENDAVNLYARKLGGLTPKFRVELERYAPTINPATLGVIDRDEFYFWLSMPITGVGSSDQNDYGDGMYGHEVSISNRFGYMFPVIAGLGLDIEMIWSHQDNSINFPYTITDYEGAPTSSIDAFPTDIGGSIGIGYNIIEPLSAGAAFHFFNNGNLLSGLDSAGMIIEGNYFAIDAGILLRFFDSNLLADLHSVFTNQEELYVDLDAGNIVKGDLPLLIEGTVTGSLFSKTLFLACKGISEIYFDSRQGFFQRVVPIVEYWPLPFLAVRGGYEFSYIDLSGNSGVGNGFLAGLSAKLWDFSLNANFSYRTKPLHILPGYQLSQSFILIGLTYSPGLLTR